MSTSARAAAVRGDNYQYAIAWVHAADALRDAGVASISVEDAGGGQFDDVVVRRADGAADLFLQVKSSNSGDVDVDEDWLTTASSKQGRSPLQHFYATWNQLKRAGRLFELKLITNRGFDSSHPLLGPLRDNYAGSIRVGELRTKSARTDAGKSAARWVAHLGIDLEHLYGFLEAVQWEQAGPESTWRGHAKRAMRVAGLRDDDEAVEVGIAIIRGWVMTGAGPQSADDIRAAVDQANLLADSAQLVFAVYGIDRPASPDRANVSIDWVDRFAGQEAADRYQVMDPADWRDRFPGDLRTARRSLEAYRARRVQVTGALRQAMFFAVGATLLDVRRWVLTVQQRDGIWTTDADPRPGVTPRELARQQIGQGPDIAVAVALANDITAAVADYVLAAVPTVSELLVLGPEGSPGGTAVPSNAWLTGWVRATRDVIREFSANSARIHLFVSGPASAALMLGHQWNTLPAPTTVYEYDRLQRTYFPTFEFA